MSITPVEFFPSPRTLSDGDYAEISLKVVAKLSRDVATMKTHIVFYAESLPAVMPSEPGEYPCEVLMRGFLVESCSPTDCVTPACNAADAAAHWFCARSKTGHSGTAWLLVCRDAFALIADGK